MSIIINEIKTQHPIEIKTIDKTDNLNGFELFCVICQGGDAVGHIGFNLGEGHALVDDGQYAAKEITK